MSREQRPLTALRDLIARYGRETTSFQTVEPGLSYWFDPAPESDACVAYVDTGGAWVSVGPPLAPLAGEDEVSSRFVEAAGRARRRACFFAVERSEFGGAEMRRLHLGEQPRWDPQRWAEVLRGKRSLREQLRRARAKQVTVRRLEAPELADREGQARRAIDALVARWLDSREMAPMGFVVQIDLDTLVEERRVFVAERAQQVVGVLAAVPIPAASGWFFEDVLRHPEAPNGTIELLFDHAMRDLCELGCRYVTYGLAPLAHTPSSVLRWIRDHTRWLYHFDGLRAFKAKLCPDGWRPVYLAYPDPGARLRGDAAVARSQGAAEAVEAAEAGRDGDGRWTSRVGRGYATARAVADALSAFAGGSLWRFGWATLRHRAAWVTYILAILLLPWTAAMALSDGPRWFPSGAVKLAWIGFDLVLFGALIALARRWRRWLAVALSVAASGDFALGCLQAVVYNGPRSDGPVDWVVIALALGAPLFAAVFLWSSRGRATLYTGP
ncbi:MAG: hypothetical protein Tsb0020_08640 [Haliangiales bacterium]